MCTPTNYFHYSLTYIPQLLCELVPFYFFCHSHFPQLVSKRGILQLKLLADNRQEKGGEGGGGREDQATKHGTETATPVPPTHTNTHVSAYSNDTMQPK